METLGHLRTWIDYSIMTGNVPLREYNFHVRIRHFWIPNGR